MTKFNWSKIVIKTIIRININKLFYNYKFYKIRKICQAKYITFLQEVPSRSLNYAYFVWRITMWYTYINHLFSILYFFHLCFHLDGAILVSREIGTNATKSDTRIKLFAICRSVVQNPEVSIVESIAEWRFHASQ